jgi:hypothetical protein
MPRSPRLRALNEPFGGGASGERSLLLACSALPGQLRAPLSRRRSRTSRSRGSSGRAGMSSAACRWQANPSHTVRPWAANQSPATVGGLRSGSGHAAVDDPAATSGHRPERRHRVLPAPTPKAAGEARRPDATAAHRQSWAGSPIGWRWTGSAGRDAVRSTPSLRRHADSGSPCWPVTARMLWP